MKLLIKLSIAIIALLTLMIGLLLAFVDPNDYKNEIQTQVKNSINRDLHINGDIAWTFFPQLGFSSGEIELDNLANFSKPLLLKIHKASLGINILPLLKGQISIGELTIDGFELTLLTNKNGISNLDNMVAASSKVAKPTKDPSSTKSKGEDGFWKMNKTQLAGININNAVVEVEDLQAASYQKITINEIKLGRFALDEETQLTINSKIIVDDLQAQIALQSLLLVSADFSNITLNKLQIDVLLTAAALPNGQLKSQLKSDINFAVQSKLISVKKLDINTIISADNLPHKKITTQLNANIDYQLDKQLATIKALKLKVDDIELVGEMSVQTANIIKVRYDLRGNHWDLNNYLSKTTDNKESTASSGTPATGTPNNTTSAPTEIEPDLSFLHDVDVEGKIVIAGIDIDNIKIGEIKNRLIIKQGKVKVKPLTAKLYEGLLTVNGEIDESKGRNRYNISTKLDSVQVHPLLVDVAALDLISGTTNFNFSAKGQGLTTTKIKQGLIGQGNFSLLDGELYGVNLSQEMRTLKAKLKGQSAPTGDAIKKTDFASLTGNFSIANGLVNNHKLLMLAPVMRLDGAGLVHIIKESLDYKLSISPLSKSTKDTDYLDLSGLTIPLLITGTLSEPTFSVDTDSALKEQLKLKLAKQQKKIQEKADQAIKKYTEDLDSETQDKIKKESKRLIDSLKKFF